VAVQSSNLIFSQEGLKIARGKKLYFIIKIKKSVLLVIGVRGVVPIVSSYKISISNY
jgi:hypothetical protein